MDITQEQIKEIVLKLKGYYPNRAEEASQILLHEYELPLSIASAIMYLVRTLAEKDNFLLWQTFDVRTQPFHIN